MNRTKIQKILNKLDGKNEVTMKVIADFDMSVKALRDKLEQDITVATLNEVNLKINKLRKSIDLSPILQVAESLQTNFKENALSTLKEIEDRSAQVRTLINDGDANLSKRIEPVVALSETLKKDFGDFSKNTNDNLTKLGTDLSFISNKLPSFADKKDTIDTFKEVRKEIKKGDEEGKEYTDKARIELINRINNRGGGNMNRNIAVGGNSSVLGKYTDLNIKPGANVTLTYTNNETTKYTDLTIAATGGSGGMVRSINTISANDTAGNATGTDYVYLCAGEITLTLPTAVGNTNLYTIKNIGGGIITIAPVNGELIDENLTIVMPVQFTSVDLISDTSNWNIT